jgi:hypothetical protein
MSVNSPPFPAYKKSAPLAFAAMGAPDSALEQRNSTITVQLRHNRLAMVCSAYVISSQQQACTLPLRSFAQI